MAYSKKKVLKTVELAFLIALVVVLQIISALIPPIAGMVSITLTLIPVVVGGIMLGKRSGALLGFAFGVIVLINCMTALDPGGNILWNVNPFLTAAICLIKGTAAGFVPAVLYELISGKGNNGTRKFIGTLVAALSAPIVNTGLFICGMILFFGETLKAWSGGTNIIQYIILGLAGINFLVEFSINILLSPALVRISTAVKRKVK